MSRIHEALRKAERENGRSILTTVEPASTKTPPVKTPTNGATAAVVEIAETSLDLVAVSPDPRLIALTDPLSLGAEKFRALATRLDNLRANAELKSIQITSATKDDGKTLTSGNLAVTMATRSSAKVLLIEGDLHKPALAKLFGIDRSSGISDWWNEPNSDIQRFVRHLQDTSLWLLTAGDVYEQPSDILRSPRFAKALAALRQQFDWVVVDSTPFQPMVDANLWSRLVDGMVLVVREGKTRVKALKRGLQSLDNPKLLGIVLNEASEFNDDDYQRYYAPRTDKTVDEKQQSSTEDVT